MSVENVADHVPLGLQETAMNLGLAVMIETEMTDAALARPPPISTDMSLVRVVAPLPLSKIPFPTLHDFHTKLAFHTTVNGGG